MSRRCNDNRQSTIGNREGIDNPQHRTIDHRAHGASIADYVDCRCSSVRRLPITDV
jgi:hypothetical protein